MNAPLDGPAQQLLRGGCCGLRDSLLLGGRLLCRAAREQRLGLVLAAQGAQLFQQLGDLPRGQPRRLAHRLGQQGHIPGGEGALGEVVGKGAALPCLNGEAKASQCFQIVVEAFALGGDALGLQHFQHLGQGDSMVLVGFFQQQLGNV